jgi:hypothetical protein
MPFCKDCCCELKRPGRCQLCLKLWLRAARSHAEGPKPSIASVTPPEASQRLSGVDLVHRTPEAWEVALKALQAVLPTGAEVTVNGVRSGK